MRAKPVAPALSQAKSKRKVFIMRSDMFFELFAVQIGNVAGNIMEMSARREAEFRF